MTPSDRESGSRTDRDRGIGANRDSGSGADCDSVTGTGSRLLRPRPGSRRPRRAGRRDRRERRRLAAILRTETVGGCLILGAAVLALALANSPAAELYDTVRDRRLGPASLGLNLTVGQWTADGLLAVFFFLAGLELKTEFVSGHLRSIREATVPVLAAVGGMVAPAIAYLLVTAGDPGARMGWAIPTATDIAFALAVLAVVGRNLPAELRTFLLALAVVDDLLAIVVIAVFFAHDLRLGYFAASLAAIAVFAIVLRRVRRRLVLRRALLTVAALAAWAFMLRSGVHATVAGVLMGFTVPVIAPRRRDSKRKSGYDVTPGSASAAGLLPVGPMARRIDDALRPLSAGIAVPLFAFFAAGVTVGGLSGLVTAWGQPVTLGVAAGLVVGKAIGICGTALVVGRLVRSPLLRALAVLDWIGVALVGGVGFTVSLLIGQLAFAGDATRAADAQIGVVTGSVLAAVLAAVVLGARNRHYATLNRQRASAQQRDRGSDRSSGTRTVMPD
jgi:NhaA family Na+:H+ antiporter